ncbi:MAG TPA: type II toxin-antitoxin system RelE/ParE family toxin [Ignavibacteriaceae bacterium]|jgi:addiction module RelE/StbE family toxin
MKVFWTKESIDRLNEIELYIARDNPNAAIKFIDNLISLAENLSKNPERGRVVPEFSIKTIRELLYKNYRIVYLIKKNGIEVLTVFEGHRLLNKEEVGKNIKIN